MPDAAATAPAPADAAGALAFLTEMSPDLRGGAILAADGTVLAASGEAAEWAEEAVNLLRVADADGFGNARAAFAEELLVFVLNAERVVILATA